MRIHPRYAAITASVLIAIAAASCDSHKPTTPSPIAPTPATPASPSNVRLELNAPASIAPGVSLQLGVNVVKSDNSVQNVTAQSQWFSSNPRVIEINAAGMAKGNATGEAVITVRYQSLSASTEALVLPDGTYRVKGTVTDAGVGLGGVMITVIGGVGDGLVATSDGNGAYGLYGVRGRIRLQAKRDGYLNRIEEVDAVQNRLLDFEMTLDGQRPGVGGRYVLTIARMPCTAAVPDVRSYDATVEQNGPRLAVTLAGADFIVTRGHGNSFSGVMDGSDRVTFSLGAASYYYYYYYYYGQYDVVERLSSTSALVIDGKATATVSPTRISGTLNGEFLLVQGNVAPFRRILGRCSGSAHRFEMVRR
jgi:hypothetical protein